MYAIRRDPDRGYIDTLFWVPKSKLNVDGAKAALTFEFFDEREQRLLCLYRETPSHLLVPREFWDPASCDFETIDCRPISYPEADIRSHITLDYKDPSKSTQKKALAALLECRGGILQLKCGGGKTVIALELIAEMQVPALIVVDNTQLMQQWEEAIAKFLTLPGGLGRIQADVFDWQRPVVLATYTTLANHADMMPEEIRRWFGLVIWDEAHHMAAPTWAKSADLFYGKRIALTATPIRTDGYHVIYDFHVGQVVYRDLTQDLKPDFYFLWTGLKLDLEDIAVKAQVLDVTGEVHLSKMSTYFATWQVRLGKVLAEVRGAAAEGRRILVLSKSVDELVNLLALWNGVTELYTSMPWPTAAEVGETLEPIELSPKKQAKLEGLFALANQKLEDPKYPAHHRGRLKEQREVVEMQLAQHAVWRKTRALRDKRQKQYLKDLLAMPSSAGLMIHQVLPKARMEMLRSKQVTFAIAKYGREGLDEERLDTIIVTFPISDRNSLQQLMGRIQRKMAGKKRCVVVFLEDDIGPLIGMCRNIRRHLREWPVEDGGPYTYSNINHPKETPAWTRSLL